MTRPLSRRVLLALVSGATAVALVVPGAPSAASPAPPEPQPTETSESSAEPADPDTDEPEEPEEPAIPADPLRVVIERLSPSSLPARGRVRVAGTIVNRSEDAWTDLGVYLLTSFEPMTTEAELAAAVASDPRTEVGNRIVEPGLFTEAADLDPGEKTSFSLSVPVDRLVISGAAGVYWIGVHVLGTSPAGRLDGADGRARTFLPLVPERNEGTELALAVQFRNHIVRAPDGRLEFIDGWQATLSRTGRLRRLLDFATSAPDEQQLGWVVDPAVLDAALSVSRGNPALELAPAEEETPVDDEEQGSEGTEEPSQPAAGRLDPQEAAASWLEDFSAEAAEHPLLSLPYGDLDVSSVARHGLSDLLTAAFASSTQVLGGDQELITTPVLLPPSGQLAPGAFEGLEPALPVILAPEAVEDVSAGPLLNRLDGGRILLSPTADAFWGPRPGASRTALAVRQRVLADAALHALSGDRGEPLVRILPPAWDPGKRWRSARFFEGLDTSWLAPADLADLLTGVSIEPAVDPVEDLAYPESSLDAELPLATVLATEALIAEGAVVEELVTDDSDVDEQVGRQALLTSSVWSRRRPGAATERALAARNRVTRWLDEVTVRGPSFVTMSSETGTFQVTVVNGLDQRVTVGLDASLPGEELQLSTPEPIELPPNGRGAMRIDATATDIGVHEVTLQPVTTEGTPLGEPTEVSIRSSRVGFILWIVMAVGGTALFGAILLRLWRRVRRRRRTHGPLLGQVSS